MSSLSNILSFIELRGYSISEWEKEAGVGNATFNNYRKRNGDLPAEAIDRISKKWGQELRQAGYYIINIDPFDPEKLTILNEDEFRKLASRAVAIVPASEERKGSKIDFEEKYFEIAERERKALEDDKAFFKEVFKTSLIAIREDVREVVARQKGTGDVVLQALERIEGKPVDELVHEADMRLLQIDTEVRERGKKVVPRKLDRE